MNVFLYCPLIGNAIVSHDSDSKRVNSNVRLRSESPGRRSGVHLRDNDRRTRAHKRIRNPSGITLLLDYH